MYGDRIEPEDWPLVASSWPYYLGKFTINGLPLFSESLLTVEFQRNRLEIKLAVPRPRNLTVGMLLTIVLMYMSQLETAGELSPLGFSPSDLDSLYIEGATSSDLVDGLLSQTSQAWPNAPTLFVGSGYPSADADNENPSEGAARTFIVVQTRWIRFPDKSEQSPDILMRPETIISEVKSFIESHFFQVMNVNQQQGKTPVIVRHDVVVRGDDGHWTKVPDAGATTLGSVERPVRSVIRYRDCWQTG